LELGGGKSLKSKKRKKKNKQRKGNDGAERITKNDLTSEKGQSPYRDAGTIIRA